MSLEIYARQEIANVLRGVSYAGESTAELALNVLDQALLDLAADQKDADVPREALVEAYREGFRTALLAVGLAFGLGLPEQTSLSRQ